MSMARSIKTGLLAACAACLLATVGVSVAHAESAWWGITSQPRPTYLVPGKTEGVAGVNEVQAITVSAEEGAWYVETEKGTRLFLCGQSAAEVQAGLEEAYGKGNVKVPSGECNAAGNKPYEVVFTGDLAEIPVPLMKAGSFAYYPLKGGREEANVREVARGAKGKSTHQTIVATVANIGDAQVVGTTVPIKISDHLPEGVEAYEVEAFARRAGARNERSVPLSCSLATVTCEYPGAMLPYQVIEMYISVNVEATAKPGINEVRAGGGQIGKCAQVGAGEGAFDDSLCVAKPGDGETGDFELLPVAGSTIPAGTLAQPTEMTTNALPFGVDQFEMKPEAEGGKPFAQAGGHPFQLSTTLALNIGSETTVPQLEGMGREFTITQPATPRTLTFKLPRGLIGNPSVFPQCSDKQFTTFTENSLDSNECPADSAMGVAIVGIAPAQNRTEVVPVFNLAPEHGEPARFGFTVARIPVILDTAVRTGEDYGVTVTVHNTNQTAAFLFSQVIFWGTPSSAAHRLSRGSECINAGTGLYNNGACEKLTQPEGQPFLSMPTTCSAKESRSLMEWETWAAFESEGPISAERSAKPLEDPFPVMTGCNGLNFEPSIKEAVPDVKDASTPTGLTVDVRVPQDAGLNPNGVAESAVKQIEVALPEGVTVNPGGADGLQACSEAQIGFLNKTSPNGELLFTPDYPSCPDQSKIATVTIHTPLLPHPLEGFVYLATPSINGELGANPFNSLISMYLVAHDPVSGVLVKLPMHVSLSETGQLTTTVENPELPFEDAELHFFGGSRAPLSTPALCGSYTTNAVFTPWSGNEPVHSSAQFTIDSGPNGSPCFASPRPFAPGFQAGTTNLQAGAFTPFTTTLGHPDGEQPLGAVSMKLPPGLLGLISSVKLCEEPQASLGTCGPESLIGHTVVTAGLGSTPAVVARPGNVYITAGYKGAPFGLSIANPAETGPFDLEKGTPCDCVVVRAKIEVNPTTAALTIVSDPLPTILKGIPLQLQHVNVTVDRPGFTFNPTNCAHMAIEGTMSSSEGANAPVSTPFQATNCATLKFAPKFAVSTSAKTSKAKGASLTAKLSYPAAPQGTQANITRVKVDLPIQLPSQLKTLQKACLAKVFEANPAACPPESIVGHAKVITPILPVPLTGPAYFVSHGGEAFPSLTMVLQGYGVTVELVGTTLIKKGITSTTFKTVPDVPFNSFELTLPQGKYAALTAYLPAKAKGSFCGQSLKMPTEFIAQNGAAIHQTTPVSVTGCPKAKTRAQKLKAALKACKKNKKANRASCVKQAHRKYGPLKKKK